MLDPDDVFLPERLERLVALAEAAGADLIADDQEKRDFASGEPLGLHFPDGEMADRGPLALIELVRRDMPDTPSPSRFGVARPLIRWGFLLEHGIRHADDILVGEDFLFHFERVARGARLHLTREVGYVHRMRGGSVSGRRDATLHRRAANRRMLRAAMAAGDGRSSNLLLRRQRLIEFDSFALAVERGDVRAALGHAHCGHPGRMLRHAPRMVAGAVRRRIAALV